MGKRRHKDNSESIRRKIKRLERKLDRRSRRHEDWERPDTSSSYSASNWNASEEENIPDIEIDDDEYMEPSLASTVCIATQPTPTRSKSPLLAPSEAPASTSSAAVVPEAHPAPPPDLEQLSPTALPDEIIELLGEAKTVDEPLGQPIPKEISERWGKILLDGLAKDQKETLLKSTLIPENFTLARAPKLNPEVCAVLTDAVKNRDKRLEKAQNQLGLSLAGLVNLTKDLIKTDIHKLDIIKRISEISQILLDLHYEDSVNRRKLIVPLLDKCFWSAIQGVKRETFLFGDKLGESIKISKDIEKTGLQIRKPAISRTNARRPNVSGNVRFPPRQPIQSRPTATVTSSQYYEPQPSTSARRSANATQALAQPPRRPRPQASRPRDTRRR